MIINDIILENRALNPDELNIINVLKSHGNNAAAMFSEVGPFLTVNQFKCLARWVVAKNMPTIVSRRKSEMMDSDDTTLIDELLLLEWEILNGLDNSIISEGRLDESMITSFFKLFGKNLDDIIKPFLKKIKPNQLDDVVKNIDVPKPVIPKETVPKELLKQTDDVASELVKRPILKPIAAQTDDLLKLEKKLIQDVEKKLGKELPDALKPHAPKLADEGTKGFLYKSGLKVKELNAMRKAGWPKLTGWIKDMIRRSVRNMSLATAVLVSPWVGSTFSDLKRQVDSLERVKSARRTTPTVQKVCNTDAHVIRNILHKHGWLMTSTPTGY